MAGKPNLGEIAGFTRQFAAMISSGIPLVDCLDAIAEQAESKPLKKIVGNISQDVQAGVALAEALSRYPGVFDRLYCAMVRAGESAGILSVVLLRLADYQEKSVAFRRKLQGAFAYPALVSTVAVGAIAALLLFVVPTFSSMLVELGTTPPLSTQIVMTISDLAQTFFLPAVLLIGIIAFALYYAYTHSEAVRLRADSILLSLPYVGKLQRKSSIARFSRTFGALLTGGVPIVKALEITASTANNRVIEKGILMTHEAIQAGRSLADPLKETGLFPSMVVQMVGVGERGGELPEMLLKVADYYETDVDSAISALTSILEPALIVVMGAVIAGVLVAMYLPMFEMIGSFG